MDSRDLFTLILLGALWGGSFLFMRIAAPEFGPVPLVAVRIAIGAICLSPFLFINGGFAELRMNWGHTLIVGILNSALPFALLSYAILTLTAGFAGIVNASAPIWGGLIAVLWLREPPNLSRGLGLLIGFGGVVVLAGGGADFPGAGSRYALPASLAGAFSYGLAANYARRYLSHVDPMTAAAGSLVGAAILLLPWAVWLWPAEMPSMRAWVALIVMGVASTALATVLYFRLIARSGPTIAISVAYLIPLFAVISGIVFLDETVTVRMLLGGGVILLGTALVTNVIVIPVKSAADG